jgi:hypothetical protein
MLHPLIINNRTFFIVAHSGNATPTGCTDRFRVHELEAPQNPSNPHEDPYCRDWTYKVAKLWACRYAETLGTLSITGYGYSKLDALKKTIIALVNKGEL